MRFPEFFTAGSKAILSFELFPPKTDRAMATLQQALPELVALQPDYMTVTYGAMGSTQARTLDIAGLLKNHYGMETACHLTCVGASRADLDATLERIVQAGIDNIVALRGDPPQGADHFEPAADGLAHANQLVAHIRDFERQHGHERLGLAVAGYPEKHLEAPDFDSDITHLKRKVDAGGDVIITQLFFDNARFFDFVARVRAAGITVPVIPGLMPILSARQIQRITSMCGASLPPALQADLAAAGDDDAKAQAIGVRQCITQAQDLLAHGVPGIHFYVLNTATHIRQIIEALPR
jgi:methylenetetrahydrofolate reductase (NADPH)